MIQSKVYFYSEFFTSQSNHWFFFALVLMYLNTNTFHLALADILCWILLGFVPAILFLVRQKVHSFFFQFLIHALLILMIVFFPLSFLGLKSLYLIFGFLYIVFSLFRSLKIHAKPVRAIPLYVSLPIMTLIAVILSVREIILSYFPYCIAMILCASSFFLAYYVNKYIDFIKMNDGTVSGMPQKRIFRSGMQVSGMYLLMCSIPMILLSLLAVPEQFYQGIWRKLREAIKHFISFLLALIPEEKEDGRTLDTVEEISSGTISGFESPTSQFWSDLETSVKLVVAIALLVLAVYLFIRLLIFLTGLRLHNIEEEDIEEENEDIHERIRSPKGKNIAMTEKIDRLSISRRIRFLYKRKVRSATEDVGKLQYTTAREFATEQNNPLLADIYEKARYSRELCTKEDLKKMQTAYRRKKGDTRNFSSLR